MLPFISYLAGKVYPTLCPHWTPLNHLSTGQEFYPWARSFSSPAARQIHGRCLPCPSPPQFCFLSWGQAFTHISISNARVLYFIKVTFVSPRKVWSLLRGGASAEPCFFHLPAFPGHAKKAASSQGMRQIARAPESVLSAADISLECTKPCCTLFQAGKSGSAFFLIFCLNPSIRLHLHTNSDPRYWALRGPYVCLSLGPVGFFEHQTWLSNSGYASQQV